VEEKRWTPEPRSGAGAVELGEGRGSMKIVWVDPLNYDPQFLNLLCIVLRDAGHQVCVCSNAREVFPPPPGIEWVPFSSHGPFPRTFHGQRVARLRVGATYGLDWRRAVRWVASTGTSSVLVSSPLALPRFDAWGLGMLRRRGLPAVALVHKPYGGFHDDRSGRRVSACGPYYRRAERLLTMTEYTRTLLEELYHLGGERFTTFPHPHFEGLLQSHEVDARLAGELAAWSSGAPVLTFASNLTEEHGLEDLLVALPRMRDLLPDLRLLLLARSSDGEQQRTISGRLDSAGLGGRYRCRWEAYSYGELRAYMEATAVMIVPYRWATQSGVVAMAAGQGVPVVATAVGGLPEMVRPGVSGELVPMGDVDSLAAAVSRVAADASGYRQRVLAVRDELFGPAMAERAVCESLAEAAGLGKGGVTAAS